MRKAPLVPQGAPALLDVRADRVQLGWNMQVPVQEEMRLRRIITRRRKMVREEPPRTHTHPLRLTKKKKKKKNGNKKMEK